jgi:CubicO group peptidase (beta-lactamase class C family)
VTDAQQLRDLIEQERKRFDVVGLSVVVVKDREVLLAEGFGARNLEQDEPATSQTLFAIASDTKAFTAALCATFVDEDRIEWDAPIREVLPWFRMQDQHATELDSLRDLLSHRTGLPRHDALWFGTTTPPAEEVVRALRHLQPSAPLRQVWQYNNLCYTTAGYIAGVLAGSDWETALRERVFDRLGMKRTTNGRPAAHASGDYATPYTDFTGTNVAVPDLGDGSHGPAGGIWSNAEEMAAWVLARLEVPLPDGTKLLSGEALRELHAPAMVKPPSPLDLPGVHNLGYGLAASIESYRGHRLVHHGGNLHGFCSDVYLVPESGHAVVVLANAHSSGIRTSLPLNVLDRLLDLEPEPWGERLFELMGAFKGGMRAAAEHNAKTVAGSPPSRPLEELAGTYTHPAYGDFVVRVEGDALVPQWHGLDSIVLRHHDRDSWDLLLGSHYEDTAMPFVFRPAYDGIAGIEVALEPAVDPIFFTRKPPTLDQAELDRLAGTYEMGPLKAVVTVDDGALHASVAGQKPVELRPRDATHFDVPGQSGTRFEFLLAADGTGETLVVQPAGLFTRSR